MSWPQIVGAAQILSALAWMGVSLHYVSSLRRIFAGVPKVWDGAGCWACAMGIVQTSFTLRWLLLGKSDIHQMSIISLEIWTALYIANAAVAVGILHTWRDGDADIAASNRRARMSLSLWAVVFLASGVLCWSAG